MRAFQPFFFISVAVADGIEQTLTWANMLPNSVLRKIRDDSVGNFRDEFQLETSVGERPRLLKGSVNTANRKAEKHSREIRPSSELTGCVLRMDVSGN